MFNQKKKKKSFFNLNVKNNQLFIYLFPRKILENKKVDKREREREGESDKIKLLVYSSHVIHQIN